MHITFHGEKSWVQGEGAVRRRVHTHQRTLVSLLVNPRLCCTEERTRGHHEFMNESQLRECLVHGKRRLRRDLGATSQRGGRHLPALHQQRWAAPQLLPAVRARFPSPRSASLPTSSRASRSPVSSCREPSLLHPTIARLSVFITPVSFSSFNSTNPN